MAGKLDKKRQQAEEWYIENNDGSQKLCAELFKITEKTVGAWSKKYNWEEKRLDYHSSPVKIKQLLQREAMLVAQGNKPTIQADSLSKIMASLDRCDSKADPIVVHRILKDLDNFISVDDPAFAGKCTKYHKLFLQHRIDLE
ncbi:hypothetical protein [Pedobacter arcticus]|uniref:hypothetical protein n=1 Tax=Pedobacter arcticus TaxID=752140 RepID=UPI0002F47681|nr:hypothetical protein [Pedobacter arcticus]